MLVLYIGVLKLCINTHFIHSNDQERQFTATQLTRKILSRERHPPIDIVIQAGIVPRCIQFLANHDNADLQFEAAWVLTNIASGNQTQTNVVVDAGAVEPFIEMLRSPYNHIAEQAIWALGNIAVSNLQCLIIIHVNVWWNAIKLRMLTSA